MRCSRQGRCTIFKIQPSRNEWLSFFLSCGLMALQPAGLLLVGAGRAAGGCCQQCTDSSAVGSRQRSAAPAALFPAAERQPPASNSHWIRTHLTALLCPLPLHRCTAAPLHRCTAAPLHRCQCRQVPHLHSQPGHMLRLEVCGKVQIPVATRVLGSCMAPSLQLCDWPHRLCHLAPKHTAATPQVCLFQPYTTEDCTERGLHGRVRQPRRLADEAVLTTVAA